MVLYHWHKPDLFNYIKRKKCVLITDDYPEITIFQGPSKHIVCIKHKEAYYPATIVRYCQELGIKPPPEFIKIKKQLDDIMKACEKNPFLKKDIEHPL